MVSSNNGVKPIKWEIPDVENQKKNNYSTVYSNNEIKRVNILL